MSATLNPYAAPKAIVEDVGANPEAEAVRRANLRHEASVRSIGTLYYLAALGAALAALSTMAQLFIRPVYVGVVVMFVAMTVLSVVFLLVGRGLRKLRRGVRVPTIALAGLGLLGFPVGTPINGYILWLMLSEKGRVVSRIRRSHRSDAGDQVSHFHPDLGLPGIDRAGRSRRHSRPDVVALSLRR